jgi:outer membrane protein TolC
MIKIDRIMKLVKNFHVRFTIVFLLFAGIANAQTRSNKNGGYQLNADTSNTLDIREKLVSLALQNPLYEIADHNLNIAIYNIRIAKGAWLGTFSAQGNVNEFTIFPKTAGNNPIYYPKYNFGLSIPFDIFSKIPNDVKIAKENYMIAQATRNDRFRQIKAEVLTKYEDYLVAKQKLELQIQMKQDAFNQYKKSEKDFEDNTIKLEEFNRASAAWISAQMGELDFRRNLNVTKIELEKMIGVRLDDVLQQIR